MIKDIITIAVGGVQYDGWIDITITKSIEDFCGTFSFTATHVDMSKDFPVKRRQSCQIYINGIKIINGWVEKISPEHSANSHTLTISGRDRTCDIIDSRLHDIHLKPPLTLESVVRSVLAKLNLSHIKVINPYQLDSIKQIISSPVQISAAEFIHNYAQKCQVMLSTNADGDIEFVRAGAATYQTFLSKSEKDAPVIVSSNADFDDSKRFHLYEVLDQENMTFLFESNVEPNPEKNVVVKATATDSEIRNSRIYDFTSQDCSHGDEDATTRVKWEANFRRAQSFVYNATVVGFKPLNDNGIWLPNRLVRVLDPFCYVDSILLITHIVYTQNSSGSQCQMKFLTSDAFTLEVEKDPKHKKHHKEGTGITWAEI
jgi:prophage tail gpP-like protein